MSNPTTTSVVKPVLTSLLKWVLRLYGLLYVITAIAIVPITPWYDNFFNLVICISYAAAMYLMDAHEPLKAWFHARYARVVIEEPDPYRWFISYEFTALRDQYFRNRLNNYRTGNYVYLVKDASVTGYFKIGRTCCPSSRMGRFDVVLPFTIHIIAIIPCDDMVKLETTLHRQHAQHRVRGEWFKIPATQVFEILKMDTTFVTRYLDIGGVK